MDLVEVYLMNMVKADLMEALVEADRVQGDHVEVDWGLSTILWVY